MSEKTYAVVTDRPWHIAEFQRRVCKFPGKWRLALSPSNALKMSPRYIFFPHWSRKIPKDILDRVECVAFHAANLPFGRGGSPVQNQIVRGVESTSLCALRMTEEIDAGPIYIARPFSLMGLAEELYIRMARECATMMQWIASAEPEPVPQAGDGTVFRRRHPNASAIQAGSLEGLFDHIRMTDADGYPRAYIEAYGYRFEFQRPALRVGKIEADVQITRPHDKEAR